ncbi:MAG: sulfotransferase domain-containing protein [Magnetococcales bacterium]|nr:sulfotransferase domain-containing protein [Magnetococcales bacterium]
MDISEQHTLQKGTELVRSSNPELGFELFYEAYKNGLRVYGSYEFVLMFLYKRMYKEFLDNYKTLQEQGCFKEYVNERHQKLSEEGVPYIFLNTLPKSGSMYMLNTLTDAFKLPTILLGHNNSDFDHVVPLMAEFLAKGGGITQAHIDPTPYNLDTLHSSGIKKIHLHVRDPRQALLSMTHHNNTLVGASYCERYTNIAMTPSDYDLWSFEQKLDWQFRNTYPYYILWLESWVNVIENDSRFKIYLSEYKMLKSEPKRLLEESIKFFGYKDNLPNNIDFTPKAGKSHFRQGSNTEWKSVFTKSQQSIMGNMISSKLRNMFEWE